MDALATLINLLGDQDKKDFKAFMRKKNKRHDVKNILLFELLNTDDINGLEKLLKKTKSRDSYHALRKRLHDNLLLFLSQKTFESNNSQASEVMRLIVVSRFLLENDVDKTAFKCLVKAEQIATKLEQYNLLNDILLLKINYAHSEASENLEDLTTRFMVNQQHMQREAKLNLAYAFLRQEMREVNLKGKVVNLATLMLGTIRKYQIAVKDLMNYKSIYQILFIANEYAAIHQDYSFIERYIQRIQHFIQGKKKADESHLFYQLHVLYFLANFHLRNRSFEKSAEYLSEMKNQMEQHRFHESQFYPRHQLLSALNLYFTGRGGEGTAVLMKALEMTTKKTKQEDIEDLRICLTMFLSLQDDRSCLRHLALFQHTDQWYEKKMGMLWTIRKNLMEVLVHAQFGHIELAVSRLSSFKRRYSGFLTETHEERVLHFASLVEKYFNKPDIVFNPVFQKTAVDLLKNKEHADIFHICFISWLIAKWEKKSAYQIVLQHLSSRHTSENS